MRLIDADALIEKWYEVNNIGPEDRGARFIGYTEIPRFINNAPTVEPTGDIISRADAIGAEEVRKALMRLTMCAREECDMCKYKDKCGFEFQYSISTENMNTILEALSAEAVQGEWVKDYEKNIYKCSVCGCEEVVPTCMGEPTVWKFCPNCGSAISTRMKGGAE